MKVVTQTSLPAFVHYECDVTGVSLSGGPAASISLRCGFKTPYDGDTFELHLSVKAAKVVIPLLRSVLLDGRALKPHRTDSIFQKSGRAEERITRRKRELLLKQLEKLYHYRRQPLETVRKGLEESAQGKRICRGSFAGPGSEDLNLTAAKKKAYRQRMADFKSGRDLGDPRERALAKSKRAVVDATRRKRALLPEFKKMIRGKKSDDVQAALNEDRGDS